MAAITKPKAKRERSKVFTAAEANLISTRVTEELDILKGDLTNTNTGQLRAETWKQITDEVNALGGCLRTVSQVKTKFSNLTRVTKEKFTANRKEARKTGGGPPAAQLTQAEENVLNVMRDTPAFSGVDGGVESDISPISGKFIVIFT